MKKSLLIIIVLITSLPIHGQNLLNHIDTSFASYERINYGDVDKFLILPNGKTLVWGEYSEYRGRYNYMRKLNSDGSIDTAFHLDTTISAYITEMKLLANNKILLIYQSKGKKSNIQQRISIINDDGSIVPSFNFQWHEEFSIDCVGLLPDGKLLFSGTFTEKEKDVTKIIKLSANGKIDKSFKTILNPYGKIHNIVPQTDGKIIIGGSFKSINDINCNNLIRLNSDGSVDKNFITGGGPSSSIFSISIQSDKKILIAGSFKEYNYVARPYIARLLENGHLDRTFNESENFDEFINTITILPNEKICVTGNFTSLGGKRINRIALLTKDGQLDPSFQFNKVNLTYVSQVAIYQNKEIMINGKMSKVLQSNLPYFRIIHFDGTPDNSFNPPRNKLNGDIHAVEIDKNDKIIIGGDFNYYLDNEVNGICRLNNNGTIDPTFDFGSGVDGLIRSICVCTNGKIIIGGGFTTYRGYEQRGIIRINEDGSVDKSFNVGSIAYGEVYDIKEQEDGKLILVGNFTEVGGVSNVGIVRLHPNGTIDNSLTLTKFPDAPIETICLDRNGKIVIGGSFTEINGSKRIGVARLHTDGSIDESFNTEGNDFNFANIKAITINDKGQLYCGGRFWYKKNRYNLVCLNHNGAIAENFMPAEVIGGQLYTISVQPNGKVWVGGTRKTTDNRTINNLVVLTNYGRVDPNFEDSYKIDDTINQITQQRDGKVIIVGQFKTYQGAATPNIVRLMGER